MGGAGGCGRGARGKWARGGREGRTRGASLDIPHTFANANGPTQSSAPWLGAAASRTARPFESYTQPLPLGLQLRKRSCAPYSAPRIARQYAVACSVSVRHEYHSNRPAYHSLPSQPSEPRPAAESSHA